MEPDDPCAEELTVLVAAAEALLAAEMTRDDVYQQSMTNNADADALVSQAQDVYDNAQAIYDACTAANNGGTPPDPGTDPAAP